MTAEREQQKVPAILARLYELADAKSGDRAALAALRRALGDETQALGALRIVVPFASKRYERDRSDDLDDLLLLSALFATYPARGSMSLGRAFRVVRDNPDSPSLELRASALLQASRDELPDHLRRIIALCKAKEVAIDWLSVHNLIRRWGLRGAPEQKQFARDFWARPRIEEAQPADAESKS